MVGRLAQQRIQRRRPGPFEVLDVLRRIAARRHGPHHVEDVRRIDILVNHHHPAPGIVAGVAVGRQHRRLGGVTRIHLLDRDHVEQPPGAGFMAPHALDAGDAGLFHLVPDHRRFNGGAGEGEVFRRARRHGQRQNRIIAVIDPAHPDHRLIGSVGRVIAHELPKWSFLAGFAGIHFALEHHLGVGRDRQAVDFARDHLDGSAAQAARIGEFVNAGVDFLMAGNEQHRVLTAADQHGAGFAAVEIFLADEAPVLAGRHPEPGGIAVVHHDAVRRGIDPSGIRVAHDDHVVGADIATAVMLMDEGRRELQQINIVVAVYIFEDRAVGDLDRRNQLEFLLHLGAQAQNQIHLVFRIGQAQHDREAAIGVGGAGEYPETLGIAGDIVEQHRRRAAGIARRDGFRDRADLEFPVGALDALQLSHLLEMFEQLAKPLISEIRPRGRRLVFLVGHLVPRFLI